ncbi:hypothetical protein L9F63_021552, partial [Diploptera punctata]
INSKSEILKIFKNTVHSLLTGNLTQRNSRRSRLHSFPAYALGISHPFPRIRQ